MTKQYGILLSYESEGKRLDIDRLRTNMKDEGLYDLRIEEKEPIGKIHTLEIYFDADIPVSQTVMSQMMRGQNFGVKSSKKITWYPVFPSGNGGLSCLDFTCFVSCPNNNFIIA